MASNSSTGTVDTGEADFGEARVDAARAEAAEQFNGAGYAGPALEDFVPRGRLIGLYSPGPGHGKTAAAKELVRRGFVSVKFAKPLKDMLRSFLKSGGYSERMIERMVEGDLKEVGIPDFGASPRMLMQTLGTEWGRETIKESLWVDMAKRRAFQFMSAGLSVIVDDMRFPNEYDALRSIGGQVWKIVRPETAAAHTHQSEGALDNHFFERVIINDGTLSALYEVVEAALAYRAYQADEYRVYRAKQYAEVAAGPTIH